MARKSLAAFLAVLFVFILACNVITKPIDDVKNIAGTAESLATALPFETLQALATTVPIQTLEALPTEFSEFGNYFDPQGTPVAVWNEIPIMPQATAGQEFDTSNYSFRFTGVVKEATDFYTSGLEAAGWSSMMTMGGGDEQGALLLYQKDDKILTVTITNQNDGTVVVLLTLA
ncbi:MAG: hypothetical protein MHPDNHAH_02332 [Anaerolineales bacterium]|nr:hypothetical protein [Anaerolineales bacterium]WKZ45114.1 MAG: hypothetical protein QY302_04915 [Anaerolineales bacterium]WKZ47736.1 MAG: hypothetical protein QY306_00020 [Anaerolineales bacterium]